MLYIFNIYLIFKETKVLATANFKHRCQLVLVLLMILVFIPRSVQESSVRASSGGLSVCVAGEFKCLPELSEVSTRQPDQPAGPHLPEPQVTHSISSDHHNRTCKMSPANIRPGLFFVVVSPTRKFCTVAVTHSIRLQASVHQNKYL